MCGTNWLWTDRQLTCYSQTHAMRFKAGMMNWKLMETHQKRNDFFHTVMRTFMKMICRWIHHGNLWKRILFSSFLKLQHSLFHSEIGNKDNYNLQKKNHSQNSHGKPPKYYKAESKKKKKHLFILKSTICYRT